MPRQKERRPVVAETDGAGPSWHAAAVFAVAFGIRLFHTWQIRRTPLFDTLLGDARVYDEWARRIAGGEWIGHDVFYQAPLYPYFLGVLYRLAGHDLLAVRVCQAFLGALGCTLLARAGRRLFDSRTGLTAGFLLAVYPPAIFFDGILQKSSLDGFLVCLAIWLASGLLFDRPSTTRRWLSLGLAVGVLGLTRENALVFAAVVLAWITVRVRLAPKARAREAAAFAAGLAVVLFPVALRNYTVSGGVYLTTAQAGPNLYIGNNAASRGTYMALREGRGSPEYERKDATDLARQAVGRELTPAEVSRYWTDRALAFVRAEPAAWLRLTARKALLLVNAGESADTESLESYAEWSLPLRTGAPILHVGLLLPLACLGLWATWRERRRLYLLYAMAVAYAASVVLFYVSARYRYPLVPFAVLFAAAGVAAVPRLLRTTDGRPRVRMCALVVAVAVLANWPLVSAGLSRAVTEHNLGEVFQSEGRFDEALVHYRRAAAIEPDWAPAYDAMGMVLFAQGHADDAIAQYTRALDLSPGLASAHYNLGVALMARDRPHEAVEHFRQALPGVANQAQAHIFLGGALAAEQRWNEALEEFHEALRLDPRSGEAARNIGSVLSLTGAKTEAIDYFRRAVALNPDDGRAQLDLASLLLDAGRYSEATGPLREAVRLNPASGEAHGSLGVALASQGLVDEAIEQFTEALRLDPRDANARGNLATAVATRNGRAPRAGSGAPR